MRRAATAALLTLLASTASRQALALGGWQHAFDAAAIGSRLPGSRPAVMVVAAGGDPDALAAAEALQASLRASGRSSMVIDGAVLGALDVRDDRTILERARSLPFDAILVVHALLSGGGHEVLVTLYDRPGKVLASWRALEGRPPGKDGALAPPVPPPTAQTEGLPRDRLALAAPGAALDGVARSVHPAPPGPDGLQLAAARLEYERRRIRFHDALSSEASGRWSEPFAGDRDAPLDPAAFYRLVGRPELARLYRRRAAARSGLLVAGAVIGAGGLVATLAGSFYGIASPFCLQQDASGNCLSQDRSPSAAALVPGIIGLVAGSAMIIAGSQVRARPTTTMGERYMAEEYNRRLRREMGLPPAEAEDF